MKKIIKLFLGLGLVLLIFSHTADAQILQTKSEVIETYGTPFYSGVSDEGENFLFYKFPVTTNSSGTYYQKRVMFFKKTEGGAETCYKFKIIEPSSETPYNVSSFTRNLVQLEDMQWKDYAKGIVYKVEDVNGICRITAWYDNEVGLAKVYKMN